MPNDGKNLERLVALLEKLRLPPDFKIRTNRMVYYEGVLVAELDIEIRGRIGPTEIAWLIECRDRPSDGPAPGRWIEQLVGRRTRFKFNKVTAVSTTGFASGATAFAEDEGIEIRTVTALAPEHFADWLRLVTIPCVEEQRRLDHATLLTGGNESESRRRAVAERISGIRRDEPVLRSTETGEVWPLYAAFWDAISSKPELSEGIIPDQPGKKVNLTVRYPNDASHFVVDTPVGAVRIFEIIFYGEISSKQTEIPLTQTAEYRDASSGELISQSATFAFAALGQNLSFELHKVAKSGETHIVLQNLGQTQGKQPPR